MNTTQHTPCHICGEEHEPSRGLSFDGMGINSCNIYRTRIATLNSDYRHLGPSMVKAVNSHDRLVEALKNLKGRAARDAEKYAPEGNEPVWAFIEDASDILAEIEGQ